MSTLLYFIRSTIIVTSKFPHNILLCLVDTYKNFFLRKRTLLFIHLYYMIILSARKNKFLLSPKIAAVVTM